MNKTEAECCDVTCVHDDIVRRIGTKMPEEELLKELADFYKIFGCTVRVGGVRMRPCRDFGYDAVGNLPSA